jgi:hypothetical protein
MDYSAEASPAMEGIDELLDFFKTFIVVGDVLRYW